MAVGLSNLDIFGACSTGSNHTLKIMIPQSACVERQLYILLFLNPV